MRALVNRRDDGDGDDDDDEDGPEKLRRVKSRTTFFFVFFVFFECVVFSRCYKCAWFHRFRCNITSKTRELEHFLQLALMFLLLEELLLQLIVRVWIGLLTFAFRSKAHRKLRSSKSCGARWWLLFRFFHL